jgi:Reverse transcriptase (RNA-dependent DNA polymerase)
MMKMSTVQILISLIGNKDWKLHQFDVNNIFLHVDLVEEVCTKVLSGFSTKQIVDKVCRLRKSLYGLK